MCAVLDEPPDGGPLGPGGPQKRGALVYLCDNKTLIISMRFTGHHLENKNKRMNRSKMRKLEINLFEAKN